MSNLHRDSLPPRPLSMPPGDRSLPPRPRLSLLPSLGPAAAEARVVAMECLEVAGLLRQGFASDCGPRLEALQGNLSGLSERVPLPQRRLLQALQPLLVRKIMSGDCIGLADLLEHRLAPVLNGPAEGSTAAPG